MQQVADAQDKLKSAADLEVGACTDLCVAAVSLPLATKAGGS